MRARANKTDLSRPMRANLKLVRREFVLKDPEDGNVYLRLRAGDVLRPDVVSKMPRRLFSLTRRNIFQETDDELTPLDDIRARGGHVAVAPDEAKAGADPTPVADEKPEKPDEEPSFASTAEDEKPRRRRRRTNTNEGAEPEAGV